MHYDIFRSITRLQTILLHSIHCKHQFRILQYIIFAWYAEFKHGRTNTDDAKRSGRSKSAVVPENIKKVHKIVLKDRKVKLREIVDTSKISEGSVFTILHENLRMRKLPRLLSPDQKQQRVDSERFRALFDCVHVDC